MTEEQLQAIKERIAATAPERGVVVTDLAREVATQDAPLLLAEVERLRAENTELENELNEALSQHTRLAGSILDIVSTLRGDNE